MRIAHVITGLSRGGAESVLCRLLEAQPNASRHLVISLTDEGVWGDYLRSIGIEVRCLGLRPGAIPSPAVVVRLTRWLKTYRPSVVQTWMYHSDLIGGVAARLAGAPVCWGIRHSNLEAQHNKRSTLAVARVCALLSRIVPDSIVSCSARAIVAHRDIGYADRFVLIHNGLSLSKFAPRPNDKITVRASLGIPEHAEVVGHVGRADPQKGHEVLLDVFSRTLRSRPSAYLLLAGLGLDSSSPHLARMIEQAGLKGHEQHIIALGARDDVHRLMNAMDIFLLTSHGEAFPNVLAEAMATGIPCVTTDVGDAAEIVGGTGWVCSARDAEGLSLAVLEALGEDPKDRSLRSAEARQRVAAHFDIGKMSAAYTAVWQRVASATS